MKILIAVDDSQESLDAAHFAYKCFGADADYVVLSVGEDPTLMVPVTPMGVAPPYRMVQAERDAAAARARESAAAAGRELPDGTELDVETGPVGATICDIATETAADVVVIGSHDRGIMERLFVPSTGRYVLKNAPCAVLVVRSSAAGEP